MESKSHEQHPDNNAWASLLGLLSPSEYFMTVDHSVLWYRHVAWAKPKGEDLKAYVTQRFSSNMVVLSLMLGAQINVFFNSSVEMTQMRSLMAQEAYGDLKFWIGFVIALDACVTIMALVATFTLWGMISAISDTNAHALLRSSIGQYVISMPPRFVVAALYLFVFWLLLAFLDMTNGPARIVLATMVFFLFFQVVVPLSAFGRLVIHTGAMSSRRVLDEEFEKELLPSGLHASLLIRATGQRNKYASVVHQYQKKSKKSPSSSTHALQINNINAIPYERSESVRSRMQSVRSEDGERMSVMSNTGNSGSGDADVNGGMGIFSPPDSHSERLDSSGGPDSRQSIFVAYPRASILNSVGDSNELREVVKQALSESERRTSDQATLETKIGEEDHGTLSELPVIKPRPGGRHQRESITLLRRPNKRDSNVLINEWAEENTVRHLYDETPAAIFIIPEDEAGRKAVEEGSNRLRPSTLNRAGDLQSLADLLKEGYLATPDSSIGDQEELLRDHSTWGGIFATKSDQPGPVDTALNVEQSPVVMQQNDIESAGGIHYGGEKQSLLGDDYKRSQKSSSYSKQM